MTAGIGINFGIVVWVVWGTIITIAGYFLCKWFFMAVAKGDKVKETIRVDVFPAIRKTLIFLWCFSVLIVLVSGFVKHDNAAPDVGVEYTKNQASEHQPVTKKQIGINNKQYEETEESQREEKLKDEQFENSEEWEKFLKTN
jgi:hypothetical protein